MLDLLTTNVAYASVDTFIANVDRLIVNPLILLLFALALLYFVYGIFEFLSNQENDEKKTKGKSHMLWGVIGMTIMIGVFTIMNLILNTLNIQGIKPQEGEVELNNYNPNWP